MHHMTLITVMGNLDFFLLKMQWHSNYLDLIRGTSLDDLVMTAEAEFIYILSSFNRKFPDYLAILNMICIGAMTHFAGDILMDASLVDHADWSMTFKTGIIRFIPDGDIPLVLNITSTVMAILTHCFRKKYSPGKYPQTTSNYQYHCQSQHMCKVA
jgi:hypothetical protein